MTIDQYSSSCCKQDTRKKKFIVTLTIGYCHRITLKMFSKNYSKNLKGNENFLNEIFPDLLICTICLSPYFTLWKLLRLSSCWLATCQGWAFCSPSREAPSTARRSPVRRPGWCSAGGAHAGTDTGPGSALLPEHSGAAPSARGAGSPKSMNKKNRKGECHWSQLSLVT